MFINEKDIMLSPSFVQSYPTRISSGSCQDTKENNNNNHLHGANASFFDSSFFDAEIHLYTIVALRARARIEWSSEW